MNLTDYTVHIVDDDSFFRNAIGRFLASKDFKVQLYESADMFVKADAQNIPGCILLDVHMPDINGQELQELLNEKGSILPIIFISGAGDIPTSVTAIKAGARDFLSKPVEKDSLLIAIHQAFDYYIKSLEFNLQKMNHINKIAKLTKREKEVLNLLIEGKLNKQVGAALGTTERTIKAHRKQILEKMEVRSLTEVATAIVKY